MRSFSPLVVIENVKTVIRFALPFARNTLTKPKPKPKLKPKSKSNNLATLTHMIFRGLRHPFSQGRTMNLEKAIFEEKTWRRGAT
jgi:hypothetical protein